MIFNLFTRWNTQSWTYEFFFLFFMKMGLFLLIDWLFFFHEKKSCKIRFCCLFISSNECFGKIKTKFRIRSLIWWTSSRIHLFKNPPPHLLKNLQKSKWNIGIYLTRNVVHLVTEFVRDKNAGFFHNCHFTRTYYFALFLPRVIQQLHWSNFTQFCPPSIEGKN